MKQSPNESNRGDILVVDDRRENLDILSEILVEEGYLVRPVTSGEMALTASRERKPDLILLDISMPHMSGLEVCRILKTEYEFTDVPILFITALHDTEHKLLAFQVGGADYITKPFNFEEVKARVSTHLKLRRLHGELRLQNAALKTAHEQLLELGELRDNLTHMIVHDLRAPLSGILGSLKFMQEDAEAEEGRVRISDLERALTSARRLMHLINDLLDIERLESAQMPLTIGEIDIAELVSVVLGLLGPERAPRVDVSRPEGLTVRGDRPLLERVLLNLLDNAFKYSPADARVNVSFQRERQSWSLFVDDRGPGIPDEFKTRVFEKFGQLSARSARVLSSGLGLAFCRLVVEAHEGAVHVEDRDGGGSRIVVRVPLDDE